MLGGELWEGAFLSHTVCISSPINFDFHCREGEKKKKSEFVCGEQSPGVVCTRLISGKVREESSQQEGIFN